MSLKQIVDYYVILALAFVDYVGKDEKVTLQDRWVGGKGGGILAHVGDIDDGKKDNHVADDDS